MPLAGLAEPQPSCYARHGSVPHRSGRLRAVHPPIVEHEAGADRPSDGRSGSSRPCGTRANASAAPCTSPTAARGRAREPRPRARAAVGRAMTLSDQRVDHRVADAHQVVAAGRLRRGTGPVVALLVARACRLPGTRPSSCRNRKCRSAAGTAPDRRCARCASMPRWLQRLHIGQRDALEGRLVEQDRRSASARPARSTSLRSFTVQPACRSSFSACMQLLAVVAGAVGHRQRERLGEQSPAAACPDTARSSSSSSPVGRPEEARSLLLK